MRAEGGLLWVKRERSGAEHDRDARLSRFSRLNLHWHDLTPELRRTALRRRVWFNCENLTRRREAVSA